MFSPTPAPMSFVGVSRGVTNRDLSRVCLCVYPPSPQRLANETKEIVIVECDYKGKS
jgi:hypothetical protein